MAGAGEFVEGWLLAHVLGEGAYGQVRLLVHARTGARVALKACGAGAEGGAAREAALHRALRHPHVLRCLGERAHPNGHYLFLEYAPGGELFERIEPDVGMPPAAARRYWRQLASGLRYLHARGVAHRDIKPENLLLDDKDRIKISDFGMATLFRHGSRERLLRRVCGTLPYAAPEVLTAPTRGYRAPPADVWAAAVVLLAMLAGELPWERADDSEPRFVAWRRWVAAGGGAPGGPWRRVPPPALQLLRRALEPEPATRARLADLMLDRWLCGDPPPAVAGARVCLSQPAGAGDDAADETDGDEGDGAARDLTPADMDALLSSSQPTHSDGLLLADAGDALDRGGGDAGVAAGGAARRLARVWLEGGEAGAGRALQAALRALRWRWRRLDARTMAVDAAPDLRLHATVAGAARGRALVQCRRVRGCGLQFQRCFVRLRALLEDTPAAERDVPMDEDPAP